LSFHFHHLPSSDNPMWLRHWLKHGCIFTLVTCIVERVHISWVWRKQILSLILGQFNLINPTAQPLKKYYFLHIIGQWYWQQSFVMRATRLFYLLGQWENDVRAILETYFITKHSFEVLSAMPLEHNICNLGRKNYFGIVLEFERNWTNWYWYFYSYHHYSWKINVYLLLPVKHFLVSCKLPLPFNNSPTLRKLYSTIYIVWKFF